MMLSGAQGGQTYNARSDQSGHFAFAGLAGGDYVLSVNLPGFATTQGRVAIGDGQMLAQDVALQVAMLHETITVSSNPAAATTPPKKGLNPHYEPKPSTCAQTIVGGCIEQPWKLMDVKPVFPPELAGSGSDTVVELEARIGTDGFVNDVRALATANQAAARAAADAVRQWRFSQTRLDGVPIEVRMNILVTFRGH
jgi:outer membrane biosynthesis protein TonB